MNIALLTAGGTGQRMHNEIPKQFLNINDKPVIMYALEAFQTHPNIDGIVIACLEGWECILSAYCRQYHITKLENIVVGGKTGQESIYNGVRDIASRHDPQDLILVHDGDRPLVSHDIISDSIRVAQKCGNAVAAIPCTEAILITHDGIESCEQVPRSEARRTQTPHTTSIKTLLDAHEKALKMGITSSIATCTLLIELGGIVYYSLGSEKNIKITTSEDLEIFRALLAVRG